MNIFFTLADLYEQKNILRKTSKKLKKWKFNWSPLVVDVDQICSKQWICPKLVYLRTKANNIWNISSTLMFQDQRSLTIWIEILREIYKDKWKKSAPRGKNTKKLRQSSHWISINQIALTPSTETCGLSPGVEKVLLQARKDAHLKNQFIVLPNGEDIAWWIVGKLKN